VGLLAMMALVACAAVLLWVGRVVWENRDRQHATAWKSVQALRSRHLAERLSAVRDLGRFGPEAPEMVLPALLSALGDNHAEIRSAAAESLTSLSSIVDASRVAAASLIGSLKDRDAAVRIAAANALATILSVRRADENPPADPRVVIAALADMLDDQDQDVRAAAVRALGLVGGTTEAAPPEALVAALDDPSPDHRASAAAALSSFTRGLDPVVPLLLRNFGREAPDHRSAYLNPLFQIKRPAVSEAVVPDLIAALDSHDQEVRCLAISLLSRIGVRDGVVVPSLIKILGESDHEDLENPHIRDPVHVASNCLGDLAPGTPWADDAITALMEVLRRGGPRRRNAAAFALGQFHHGTEVAVPALILALKENAEAPPIGGEAIADVLGRIAPGTPSAHEAIAALTAALQARLEWTRAAAIKALVRFGSAATVALPQIQSMQQDPSAEVRAAAISAVQALSPDP
jgi:HEAT repeat protein